MRGSVNATNNFSNKSILAVFLSMCVVVAMGPNIHAQSVGSGTTIGATVCAASSQISLTSPASDSVVTDPKVELKGEINQTSQIEVYIDGVFDSIIPIDVGETSFSATVQLSKGTHTIKLVAITRCPGVNGETSNVVTYTPDQPATPSDGSTTPTQVDSQGGVVVSSEVTPVTEDAKPNIVESLIIDPLQNAASWLNISTAPTVPGEPAAMPAWRAVTVGAGVLLTTFGAAGSVVTLAAASPVGTSLMSSSSMAVRTRMFGWGFRILGIAAVIGALFI